MRYHQIIEMPMASISLQGEQNDDFDAGKTFDDKDRKLLQSPKAQQKIMRAFANTKQTFRVVFINLKLFNANDDKDNNNVDAYIKQARGGIHDDAQFDVEPVPGQITVVSVGNLSPNNKMPMTAWTLAHKIGHSFQDYQIANTQWADQPVTEIITGVKKVDALIFAIAADLYYRQSGVTSRRQIFNYPASVLSRLSMKSARTGKLDEFEIFPEIIAEYLIKGRVTIKLDTPEQENLLVQLNAEIANLFDVIVGKVLVEV